MKEVYILERKFYKFALLISMSGLLLIAVVLLSKSAYPDVLFRFLLPAALLLIFVSFGLFVLAWICLMKRKLKEKSYLTAVLFLLIGIIVVFRLVGGAFYN